MFRHVLYFLSAGPLIPAWSRPSWLFFFTVLWSWHASCCQPRFIQTHDVIHNQEMLYPFAVLRGAALVQWRLTKTRARLCSSRDAYFLGYSDFDADVCKEMRALLN